MIAEITVGTARERMDRGVWYNWPDNCREELDTQYGYSEIERQSEKGQERKLNTGQRGTDKDWRVTEREKV